MKRAAALAGIAETHPLLRSRVSTIIPGNWFDLETRPRCYCSFGIVRTVTKPLSTVVEIFTEGNFRKISSKRRSMVFQRKRWSVGKKKGIRNTWFLRAEVKRTNIPDKKVGFNWENINKPTSYTEQESHCKRRPLCRSFRRLFANRDIDFVPGYSRREILGSLPGNTTGMIIWMFNILYRRDRISLSQERFFIFKEIRRFTPELSFLF